MARVVVRWDGRGACVWVGQSLGLWECGPRPRALCSVWRLGAEWSPLPQSGLQVMLLLASGMVAGVAPEGELACSGSASFGWFYYRNRNR